MVGVLVANRQRRVSSERVGGIGLDMGLFDFVVLNSLRSKHWVSNVGNDLPS